jgi:hypothetical protein
MHDRTVAVTLAVAEADARAVGRFLCCPLEHLIRGKLSAEEQPPSI